MDYTELEIISDQEEVEGVVTVEDGDRVIKIESPTETLQQYNRKAEQRREDSEEERRREYERIQEERIREDRT